MIKSLIKKIVPRFIYKKLKFMKDNYFGGFYTVSYSQEGEDLILSRYFENQESGFYVDVGAHHPKRFSNTYNFYKKGWSGINIDAMPGSMELFNKFRPRDINIEVPISDTKQKLDYYIFNDLALNGFSKDLSEERDGGKFYVESVKKLETSRLEEVLDQYVSNDIIIDFMSIDVEGLDFNVLKSINLEKYRPKIILVEILDANLEELVKDEITMFLKENNYKVFAKSVNTVFFRSNI